MDDALSMMRDVWGETFRAMVLLSPPVVLGALFSLTTAKLYSVHLHRSMWPIAVVLFMFGLFGATIGIFMGASKQPIVASILPPVITLASGYIVLTKTSDLSIRTRLILPAALMMLLLMLLLGAFYMKGYTSVLPTIPIEPG